MKIHSSRYRSFPAFAVLLLVLSACATEHEASKGQHRVARALPAAGQPRDFAWLLAQSHDFGPVRPDREVSLVLTLRDRTAQKEASDLAAMYNPKSPDYGHFQSPSQYAAAYGPSRQSVTRLEKLIKATGMRASWERGDSWIPVQGRADVMERSFHVPIHRYASPRGVRFYASARDPRVPSSWRWLVNGAGHISSYLGAFGAGVPRAVPTGGLTPGGLLTAYDIKPLRAMGLDGSGQTISFLENDGFRQSDLDRFTSRFGLPPLRPTIAAGPTFHSVEGETEMDLEVAHEIAPRARLLIYNEDDSAFANASSNATQFFDKEAQFENHMVSAHPGGIISESLGECELGSGASGEHTLVSVYDKADHFGDTVFVSTGDSGAFTCLDGFAKPGTIPGPHWVTITDRTVPGVTAMGGTRLSVRRNGDWYNETVWEDPDNTGGTGGGVSAYTAQPSWQKATGTTSLRDNPHSRRSIPDLSADSDPASGTAIYTGGSWSQGGGTSQASPIMAGVTALINQYMHKEGLHSVGFLNPALYALARSHQPYPPYHDITLGNNLWYPATRGYDLATGLGTPNVWNLARDLAAYQRTGK